jgi:hypothetical protein
MIPFDLVPLRFVELDDPLREEDVLLPPEPFADEADFPVVDRDVDFEAPPPPFDADFDVRDAVPLPADDVFDFMDPFDPDLAVADDRVAVPFLADGLFDDLEVERDEVDFAVEDFELAPDDFDFDAPDFDVPDFDAPDLDAADFEEADREVEDFLVVAMMFLRVIDLGFENVRRAFLQTMCLEPKMEIYVTWKTNLVSNPCASTADEVQIETERTPTNLASHR